MYCNHQQWWLNGSFTVVYRWLYHILGYFGNIMGIWWHYHSNQQADLGTWNPCLVVHPTYWLKNWIYSGIYNRTNTRISCNMGIGWNFWGVWASIIPGYFDENRRVSGRIIRNSGGIWWIAWDFFILLGVKMGGYLILGGLVFPNLPKEEIYLR